jgi:hypothetical protein
MRKMTGKHSGAVVGRSAAAPEYIFCFFSKIFTRLPSSLSPCYRFALRFHKSSFKLPRSIKISKSQNGKTKSKMMFVTLFLNAGRFQNVNLCLIHVLLLSFLRLVLGFFFFHDLDLLLQYCWDLWWISFTDSCSLWFEFVKLWFGCEELVLFMNLWTLLSNLCCYGLDTGIFDSGGDDCVWMIRWWWLCVDDFSGKVVRVCSWCSWWTFIKFIKSLVLWSENAEREKVESVCDDFLESVKIDWTLTVTGLI